MTRKERIKQHFQQYKSYYIFFGTAVTVAGITTLIMRDHQLDESLDAKTVTDGTSPGAKTVTDGTPGIADDNAHIEGASGDGNAHIEGASHFSFINNSNIDTVNAVVNVFEREGRGHPGYLTRCVEDDVVFASQLKAAIAYDATPKEMTDHLAGRRDHINGYHFERLHLAS